MATSSPLLISFPGGWEWMIILVVVLIFFGNRIPGMARSLGSGISEFKAGLKEGEAGRGKGSEAPRVGDGNARGEAGPGGKDGGAS